jgi:two-component system cell cycle response regulator
MIGDRPKRGSRPTEPRIERLPQEEARRQAERAADPSDDWREEASASEQTVELGPAVQELLARMREASPPTRCLMVIGGRDVGRVVQLPESGALAGRDSASDLVLLDSGASRRHARFARVGMEYTVSDLDSRNGVFVNGNRVTRATLVQGDKILLGLFTVLKYAAQDDLELEYSRRMLESVSVDALTGALNRRALDQRLAAEWAYAVRHTTTVSCLMIDADHFKAVNDAHGHAVGDRVLQVISATIAQALRTEDVLGRYGGEEFVVVARDVGHAGATRLAERLRQQIEQARLAHGSQEIRITASIGVATGPVGSGGPAALLDIADQRLYAAKNGGRNRVASD